MKTIKVKYDSEVKNCTGIVEWENGIEEWYKNGKLHREDGPARFFYFGDVEWYLEDKLIWASDYEKIDFTNKIILSKEQHSLYPIVQVWKYIDENGVQEQIVIPGMEECFIE